MKKGKTILTVCASILGVVAVGGLFYHGHVMEKTSNAQVVRMHQRETSAKKFDNLKRLKAKQQLFAHALTSRDPTVKSVAINKEDNSNIHQPFLSFFNIFYNWKSHQDYVSRPKKLKKLATSNVLRNKNFFDNDRDDTNGSVIENEQLNSEFNDMNLFIIGHKGNNIDVLADVQYNSWHTETDNQATGEKWFEMNYNTKQKQITTMKELYTQHNVNNANA